MECPPTVAFKVLLVGPAESGKTSLFAQFNNEYSPDTAPNQTIGVTVGSGIKALNFVAGLLGISTGGLIGNIGKLAGSLLTQFAPAVAGVAGAITTAGSHVFP